MRIKAISLAAICFGGMFTTMPAQAWEPSKPIEIIVPAGTGGGADQMARVMQGIITKHNLSKQSVVVINKSGGAGGEGLPCRIFSPLRSRPEFLSAGRI